MPELRQLRFAAGQGLAELVSAAASARRNPVLSPLTRRAWGPWPVLTLGLVAIACGLAGVVLDAVRPQLPFVGRAIGAVLLLSAVAAWRVRSVLREAHAEVSAAPVASFRALALPLVPAAFLLALASSCAPLVLPASWPGATEAVSFDGGDWLGAGFGLLLGWLGQGAGVAVCTATLAGRRAWLGSLFEIAWRYFVFKILLWVSLFVVGIASGVFWSLIRAAAASLLGWRLPEAFRQAMDRVLDGGLVALVALAFIGGSWIVAEQCFPRLLRTGDVHFLNRLSSLLGDDDEPAEEKPDPSWPGAARAESEAG